MRIIAVIIGVLTLVLGFAAAEATGARWVGGLVLVGGGVVAAFLAWHVAGPWRALIAVAVFVLAFAVAHPLGRVIGGWPAVAVVSAVAAVFAYAVLRPRSAARVRRLG